MSQVKEQYTSPGKQLDEVEIGKLPGKEFRKVIVIQDLGKRMEKMQEMFAKYLELKNKQTEMNNTLEEINSRITETEERISDLEDRMVEITVTEQNIEKRMKKERQSKRPLLLTSLHLVTSELFPSES